MLPVNMKKSERKRVLEEVKEKTRNCLESRKNANDLISIISLLQDENEKVALAAIQGVNKIFSHYLGVEEMVTERALQQGDTDLTKEEQYKLWLRERYTDATDTLVDLLQTAGDSLQCQCLSTLMKFVMKEGRQPLQKPAPGHTHFPVNMFARVLSVLLSGEQSRAELIKSFEEYLDYVDVRYYTLSQILLTCQDTQEENEVLAGNMFGVLQHIKIGSGKGSMKKFIAKLPETPHKMTQPMEHKKLFSSTWIQFLKLKLGTSVYRQVLVLLHDKVMPYMQNPLLLSDFLTESYAIGGAFSLLALNGLFILVHKYNLNYPDFYEKLYALFEPSVFHMKYRSRFFHLCDLFLSSTHLPAYLVAAFAKRLARISLTAPPPGLLIAVPFIYNLIHRHPACKQLIDRPDTDMGTYMFESDPYDPEEPDPAKCRALDSCLWELKTLQHHYHPGVVRQARKMDGDLPAMEMDIHNVLDATTDELFEKDVNKKLKTVAVTFHPPSGLLGNKEDKLKLCWAL